MKNVIRYVGMPFRALAVGILIVIVSLASLLDPNIFDGEVLPRAKQIILAN